MKKLITYSLFAALLTTGTALKAQQEPKEYLGLPGDNLNLYAVMQLFQQSKTLEDFERELNDPANNINNLDLNGDNRVDYLNVVDNVDHNVHNIVIQDQVSPSEIQDVAVFTVQRFPDGEVQIQLTGDEALYGRNYIIEPYFDNGGTPNPGYTGNATVVNGRTVTVVTTTPVQIATWPVIRFIYSPTYVVWRSSWRWGYYPVWWHPWRPVYWDYYYGYHYNQYNHYYRYYRRWDTHRYNHWNDFYYSSHRAHSPIVYKRIEAGDYRKTYSHPNQRKAGEEAFLKRNPPENRRNVSTRPVTNTRRIERTDTHTGQPAVTGNRTTVSRRTTTDVKRSTVTGNNNGRIENNNNRGNAVNKTTVTRKTTRTEVRNNSSNARTGRSSVSKGSTVKSTRSKATKAPKESKKSTGEKKSDNSKPERRK